MKSQKKSVMKTAVQNMRNRIFSGILVIIPLVITIFIVKIIFNFLAGILKPLVFLVFGHLPEWIIATISVTILFVLLYFLGVIISHVIGMRFIAYCEEVILQIPLVKTVYHASKQVLGSLSMSSRKAFQSVVVIEYPRVGTKTLAFVTGTTRISNQQELVNVFIPTTPNPTSGFVIMLPKEEIFETNLSLEKAMQFVMSAGILAPELPILDQPATKLE